MTSYSNFQSDNQKYEKDRYDIYNPEFETPVQGRKDDFIDEHLDKWLEFISFLKWYPDYYYDLIKPKTGKLFNFDLDQRIMLRTLVRFPYNYLCIPRGGSKTFLHILAAYHMCQFFPGITMSVLASTKQSAVEIWEDKHNEIVDFFPYIGDCIKSANFSKDRGKVTWVNGSAIDNLANSQQSKGKRRRRGGVEEDNLVDKDTFEDAIAPIFNVPRRTSTGVEDPEELNGQINRFTTSGYKNSDAYQTIIQHLKDTIDLKGSFVFTSDWSIPVHFGRQKMSVVNQARKGSITRYKQNYLCDWIGSVDSALINTSKLMKARTIKKPELGCPKDKRGNFELNEYVISVDVARSASSSNNKTAIAVLKIIRGGNGKIRQVQVVNITTTPNGLNYEEQAVEVKRVFYSFGGNLDLDKSRVKAVVVDANTIGQGLVEKLLEETTDYDTNEELGCFATINTEDRPQVPDAPQIVYALKSQGINGTIIRTFIDYVESNKLKLLCDFKEIKSKFKNDDAVEYERLCLHTQLFIDEVANLKLKPIKGNADVKVEQVVKRIDKDRYSAIAYGLFYLVEFLDGEEDDGNYEFVFSYS